MHAFKIAAIAVGLLGSAYADVFASFCDDTACTVNCGEGVDTTNSGCLGETGRNSIRWSDDTTYGAGNALAWFSDGSCADQVQCTDGFVPSSYEAYDGCTDLTGNAPASSFRFLGSC